MSNLRTALSEYLNIRRTLGFKLRDEATVLPQFIDYLEERGSQFITTDLAVQWATQPENVIALWLGHETLESVTVYVHANLQIKEQALAMTTPLDVTPGRYRPGDDLLAFLKSL